MVLEPNKDGLFPTEQPRLIGFACGQAPSRRAIRRNVYKARSCSPLNSN